jgi:hypothetical protein
VRGRKGEYRKELAEWQKAGFSRVRIDGETYLIEEAPALDKKYKHDIEVVVDRWWSAATGWRPASPKASKPRSSSPRAGLCRSGRRDGRRRQPQGGADSAAR